MVSEHYVGKRLSYAGDLCTVRYTGEVKGTKGLWLGVEWDDPTRGKHSGEHGGVTYYECKSRQSRAGSFVRLTRTPDESIGFLEGLRKKYASESGAINASRRRDLIYVRGDPEDQIEISGKIVEEVGFEKIRKLLADLHELRIVLLDGLCIGGLLGTRAASEDDFRNEILKVTETCPNIVELDLSLNLLEDWRDVAGICSALKNLRSLKVTGNRFKNLEVSGDPALRSAFQDVKELSLDDTLLSWSEVNVTLKNAFYICQISSQFPSLASLSASSNLLQDSDLRSPLPTPHLTHLTLDSNAFTSLATLLPVIVPTPILHTISLRLNSISTTQAPSNRSPLSRTFPPALTSLDLAHNNISSFAFINALPSLIPHLGTLRTSHNPLYAKLSIDEAHMLTLAHLPRSLKILNFSKISVRERENAELYYLSKIGKELSSAPTSSESEILAEHPRYEALCSTYGPPSITRASAATSSSTLPPGALGHRLVDFTFYVRRASDHGEEISLSKEIPLAWDSYRIKGIVYRLFQKHKPALALKPMQFRLVWETGEYDPEAYESSDSEDEGDDDREETQSPEAEKKDGERERGKWVKRETELVDSTRSVGSWFGDGVREVRVRVEAGPFSAS